MENKQHKLLIDLSEYGFIPHKFNETFTREDIWYKGNYEVRIVNNNSSILCRRKTKNPKDGTTSIMIRFFLPIPKDFFANDDFQTTLKYLLTKGLE
jgi:hypothetical protein